jgi:hypothetical protein
MRIWALSVGWLGISIASAWAASDAQALFDRARTKVLANLDRTPRYTCIENINRRVRRTLRTRNACSGAVTGGAADSGLVLWRDRLRLDVAIINGTETFAWAGARQFETEDVDKLVGGGATETGDFAGFLGSVFGNEARNFRYTGEESTPAGKMARFEYEVPRATSHYHYRVRGQFKMAPYSGWFLINPVTAALEKLVVIATEFDRDDEVCRVEDTIEYQTAKIGDGDFLLPRVSVMDAVFGRGTEAINETQYSGCHEYTAESTIRFDDADSTAVGPSRSAAARAPIPEGVRVPLALEAPIDGETSAAGDQIVAYALNDSKASGGVVAIHRGDRFHGRIVKLEQYMMNQPHWVIAMRFDSVLRDGVEAPVRLAPLDDGVRVGPQQVFTGRRRFSRVDPLVGLSLDRPPGGGIYVFFESGKFSLNSRFHSLWVTAAAPGPAPATATRQK